MEQRNHIAPSSPPPSSTPFNQRNNNGRNNHQSDDDGIGGWLYNFVFGKDNASQQQQQQQQQQQTDMINRMQSPTSRVMDDISAVPTLSPTTGSSNQPSVLTSPFRPLTAPLHELPPLTESPPLPPPRRTLQQQQQQYTYADHFQNQLRTPSAQQYQRGNRVSTTSTLIDSASADDDNSTITYSDDSSVPVGSRMRYGRAPAHTARRYATHRIRLTKGNLVVDRQVPDRLLNVLHRKDPEFTTMRYTAVTCDPDEVPFKNYELRQQIYQRETEIFIVITMYNEDEILFARTMHGVMKNVAHLCKQQCSDTWNTESWKKVVVSIVADGRKIINKRVLTVLAAMGIYQAGVAKNVVDDKPVEAHLYEFTTQISIDEDMKLKGSDKGIVPVQVLFCLKEKNAKKINSHRWFFNAFGPLLKPKICVLLDVGTRPGNVSIYQLWKTFAQNVQVAGACGEIRAMLGPYCKYLLNPLVAAQNFEYKMSNILDKPMESVFGYISVLPGAFSAYRYAALQNDVNGHGPLEKYFKGETLHKNNEGGLFEANMYLAEDRILCYELVAKKNERWVLQYCNTAFAVTDVPEGLPEFISQRRRWLNGSFFAGVYSLWNFRSMWQSRHSFTRLVLLTIESIYNVISLIFNWVALGNFYIAFYFVTKSLVNPEIDPLPGGWGQKLFDIFRYAYLFVLVVVFICSMGNRPQVSKWLFIGCLVAFSIIMAYMLFAAAWLTFKGVQGAVDQNSFITALQENAGLRNIIISVMSTYGLYFVSSLLYRQPMHMITSFLPYLILLPGFTNILTIYAFCNTHDVSWGTKGDNTVSKDLGVVKKQKKDQGDGEDTVEIDLPADQVDVNSQYDEALIELDRKEKPKEEPPSFNQEDYYRSFRTHLVLAWIACNALLIAFVTSSEYDTIYVASAGSTYMAVLLWTNAGLAAFRFCGSVMYLLLRLFSS